jgi:hypothetical protein
MSSEVSTISVHHVRPTMIGRQCSLASLQTMRKHRFSFARRSESRFGAASRSGLRSESIAFVSWVSCVWPASKYLLL